MEKSGYAVSIDRLYASKKTMRVCISDMRNQQYSYSPGAIAVWKLNNGELHIVDGYHRLFEALLIGKKWLMVYTSGEGYSPEWQLAQGVDKFQGNSALPYGGLENIAPADALERMFTTYVSNKGESVLDFAVDLPKRKAGIRKPVDKLAGIRHTILTSTKLRMAPDLVAFSKLLEFINASIPNATKALIQQAVDDIVAHDNATFFVKLDEMQQWRFLFHNFVNKKIYDKGLKEDQFILANYNDTWLPRLLNSEAR